MAGQQLSLPDTPPALYPCLSLRNGAAVAGSREDGGGVELMRRIARGDQEALAALYDRYVSTLLGLAQQVVRDGHDAEEVIQEVFLQIWRQACYYDPERARVSTWLILITRRKAIDRLRKARAAARARDELRREGGEPVVVPVAGRRILEGERRQQVTSALGELPAEQRQVLELAYFQGLTQRQIAERLVIPLGTVKTRSVLAMKKLRRRLSRELTRLG